MIYFLQLLSSGFEKEGFESIKFSVWKDDHCGKFLAEQAFSFDKAVKERGK